MSAICCLKSCFGTTLVTSASHNREAPPILLDTGFMGHEVVIVKNGIRICGNGGALATAPIVQSKAYFEVKVQQSGIWGIGLATRTSNLNKAPGGHDKESWVLCNDSVMRHDGNEVATFDVKDNATEGDVVGVAFDHIELNFFINGKKLDVSMPMTGMKGTVYPAVYVDDGAILDLVIEHFFYSPPPGFERVLLEQSLL